MVGLAVDDHSAGSILLIFTGVKKAVPIVHDDINGVDPAGIEEPVLIAHGLSRGLEAQGLSGEKEEGQHQGQRQSGTADAVDKAMCGHARHPI